MTDKHPIADEQPADLAAFAADTLLLDALGSGEPAPSGDGVASLLAAWRADLDADLSTGDDDQEVARLIAAAGTEAAGTEAAGMEAAGMEAAGTEAAGMADDEAAADAEPDGVTVIAASRIPGRSYRMARRVLGVAAAVLAAGGGLIIGAGHATPGSPLWPVTRVVYREQADTVQIEQTLALARKAATEGRVADARGLLAQADALIARVPDPDRAKRLRAELAAVRALLPAAPGSSVPASPTAPAPTGGPAPATGAPATGPTPLPTTAVPQPRSTSGGGQLLPPIGSVTSPGLPLPTIPPSVGPLPLPLPSGGLLPKVP